MTEYANPRALVSTEWLAGHLDDASIRIVEVDVDARKYEEKHIPGAVSWNWRAQLEDSNRRDIVGPSALEALLGKSGISNHHTIILYGDNSNAYAAWAFWELKIYGHDDVRILNGGRKKWIAEGHPLTADIVQPEPASYHSNSLNQDLRAFLAQVKTAVKSRGCALVDVRSPEEFLGKVPRREDTNGPVRAGHIPGARSIPWSLTCNEDGTFKSADELRSIFVAKDVTPDKEVITYCRVGDRASHTWFVLKHLLGYPRVRNYDGSWTEWGNLVGVAIEMGDEKEPRGTGSSR
jgi:thiosulfate/3-mercaptopyruvate sulfurtransferase